LALDEGGQSTSHTGHFALGKILPVVIEQGDCVGPRASLDVLEEEKYLLPLPGFDPQFIQLVA